MYEHIFKPIRLRSMIMQNRIIASPMGYPSTHRYISTTNYGGVSIYDKSLGGAAALVIGLPPVQDDGTIPKYERDVVREDISVMRQAGARAGALICVTSLDGPVYGPSTIKVGSGPETIEINKKEMQRLKERLAKTVIAAKNIGFDYALIHFAHDQLASLFLSPLFNKRNDEYGGSLENRMRYPIELIKYTREMVGNQFPIGLRLSAVHHMEGSYSFEDFKSFVGNIKDDIDFANISSGMDVWYEANNKMSTQIFEPHLFNLKYAKDLKKTYPDLTICLVGGVMTPEEAEHVLASGDVDMIMLGRALVADPFWVKKAKEGRSDDIVPCLRCSYCYHVASEHNCITCSVNPRFHRENRVPLQLSKAENSKKVVVIGGGPAGMKAALVASERGHQVTLIEKSDELGGQIKCAKYENHKVDLNRYREYLKHQIKKSSIEVLINTTATPKLIKELKVDSLIVAIGAKPIVPRIPGIDQPLVMEATKAYPRLKELGKKVVVIGGGTIGSEMGLDLAENGHDVTVIEKGNIISARGHKIYRISLLENIKKHHNLEFLLESECIKINAHSVSIKTNNGEIRDIDADNVIIAIGMQANIDDTLQFYNIVQDTYHIGDCDKPGKVLNATNDAYFIAVNI